MKLMPNEKVLMESDGKQLVLTTHRIRYRAQETGQAHIVSILLSELSCCELRYHSYPSLIALAALSGISLLYGTFQRSDGLFWIGIFGIVIFIFAYLLTRRQALTISSAGGRIMATTKGIGVEAVLEFIEESEAAKVRLGKIS